MTQEEREKRNQGIIEHAQQNDIYSAAREFGVSYSLAYKICRTAGFTPPRHHRSAMKLSTFQILKRLLDGERQSAIATKFEISRQRVEQVQRQAEQAGFQFGGTT